MEEEKNLKDDNDKISKDMIIAEVIEKYPYLAPYIMDYGVHCVGCGVASFETLEEGFLAHGMSVEEIDQIVIELNKLIVETWNQKKQSV